MKTATEQIADEMRETAANIVNCLDKAAAAQSDRTAIEWRKNAVCSALRMKRLAEAMDQARFV